MTNQPEEQPPMLKPPSAFQRFLQEDPPHKKLYQVTLPLPHQPPTEPGLDLDDERQVEELFNMYDLIQKPGSQPSAPRVDAISVRNRGHEVEVRVLIEGEWTTIHKFDTNSADRSSVTNMRTLIAHDAQPNP